MPKLKEEQLAVVMHNEGDILVSASAGSGKTFVMIERLIRLISEGKASVNQVLAVTFTDFAASEMKEKLKDALSDKISNGGDRRLLNELAEVATADICTLHGFCGRLIRKYFYKVGVNPDYKILDDGNANLLKRESMDKAFKEFFNKDLPWFKVLVDRHLKDRSLEDIKGYLIKVHDFCLVNADKEKYKKSLDYYYSEEGLNQMLLEFKSSIDQEMLRLKELVEPAQQLFESTGKDKMLDFTKTLIESISMVLEEKSPYVVKRFEGCKMPMPKGTNYKGDVGIACKTVSAVKSCFVDLMELVNNGLIDSVTDLERLKGIREHTKYVFEIVDEFEKIYNNAKREENALDFADLEHFALEILADEEVSQSVRDKYKYVFVDEYQDVNDIQEEIIKRVSQDNLFMVGDVKQSIYGFRGCRPEIFLNKQNGMRASGKKTQLLNYNFRSADAIIDFVNKVFSFSMTEEYYGESYSKNSMLVGGGIYPEDAYGRCEMHHIKGDGKTKKPPEQTKLYNILDRLGGSVDVQEQSGPALVANIIYQELGKDFYDFKKGEYRKVEFGDICILTRAKDNAEVKKIVKGLRAYEIPTVSVVSEDVREYPEILCLIELLKLIDCMEQDIPLATTLKSVVGGFSDEELAKIVIAFKEKNKGTFCDAVKFYIDSVDDELSTRLKEFYVYINKMRVLADFIGAHGVLKRIVQDKFIEQNLYAERTGKAKVKRLNAFINASKVDDKSLTVREFLNKIKTLPEAFSTVEPAEDNAVKIMTIHKSKGLEFPVVIVCGLEKTFSKPSGGPPDVMFDRDMGIALKSYDDVNRTSCETPHRMMFRFRERQDKIKEELRLLYVALTRAKYSLHVTLLGGQDERKNVFLGANRYLNYFPKYLDITHHDMQELAFSRKQAKIKQVLVGSPDEQSKLQMQKDFAFSYPFENATTLPLKNSVTSATANGGDQQEYTHVLFEDDKTDIERGNIAHKVMENLDFSFKYDFDTQIEKLVKNGVLVKEDLEKINLERIKNTLNAPVFKNIKDQALYREKEFFVNIEADQVFDTDSKEQVVLQGVIDLLAVSENHAVIVDYKYSSLTKDSMVKKYKKQLELYAYAVQKSLGKQVKTKMLVNLYTGEYSIID